MFKKAVRWGPTRVDWLDLDGLSRLNRTGGLLLFPLSPVLSWSLLLNQGVILQKLAVVNRKCEFCC